MPALSDDLPDVWDFSRISSFFAGGRKAEAHLSAPPDRAADLPALLLQAQNVVSRLESGTHRRRRAGMGQDFWQFRLAQPHEPSRHIDWRQSARSRQLWVRQKEAETQRSLALWCDVSASMQWRFRARLPIKRDVAFIAALALGGAALKGGENVALIAHGVKAHNFRTARALTALGERLVAHQQAQIPEAGDVPPSSEMVLISDFLWSVDQIEEALAGLSPLARHLHLICVLDPAEISLPIRGFTALTDSSSAVRHRMSIDDDVARIYEKALHQHLDALRDFVVQRGGSFTLMPTNDDVASILRPLHARLSARTHGEAR
ncbi:DUF58 domain-containing protein [Candidatus Kirkpatrickella diaphorinae]|uniref:DUF58 domain-containing protein n=1 Tax=Candidatus Kirkpatrickella diaphorinae TaxID=2984322 RepID=A0ABY6GJ12_9PROT|nr:DUF58 domain-containing protein [Candidatus Kirkpatrickella diaphorinae]UYH51500.1 DUF58 domain-containing protein [Candidatus Kirkpatrickella diaphorinae]